MQLFSPKSDTCPTWTRAQPGHVHVSDGPKRSDCVPRAVDALPIVSHGPWDSWDSWDVYVALCGESTLQGLRQKLKSCARTSFLFLFLFSILVVCGCTKN